MKAFKVSTTILLIACGVILPFFAFASTEPFSDGFETYTTGSLAGQGDWFHHDTSGDYIVQGTEFQSGSYAVVAPTSGPARIDREGEHISAGSWNFWFKKNNVGTFTILLLGDNEVYDIGCGEIFLDSHTPGKISIYDMAGSYPQIDFDDMIYNTWIKVSVEWNFGTGLYRAKLNDGNFSEWYRLYNTCHSYINGVRFFNGGSTIYIDDIGTTVTPPTSPQVVITSPASGTTITDLSTHIVGTFAAVDPASYQSLYLSFTSGTIGLSTTVYHIPSLNEGSGSFDIPLSDFEFQSNGTFNFKSNAYLKGTQLSDMLQTGNLTLPSDYHLILNISGLNTPYTFTSWDDWYSTNAAGGYSYPSDFGDAFVDFFIPIFERAGEFTNQSLLYFNANNAQDKGQQLGSVFPITQAYLDKINVFFGGFPLIQFFEFLIIVMLGVFTIRTIFKFIPFFG
ncbi:MAG: hypothetical protein Q8O66_03570 [bacterium]|nr:hypothetical protein [bacterium]